MPWVRHIGNHIRQALLLSRAACQSTAQSLVIGGACGAAGWINKLSRHLFDFRKFTPYSAQLSNHIGVVSPTELIVRDDVPALTGHEYFRPSLANNDRLVTAHRATMAAERYLRQVGVTTGRTVSDAAPIQDHLCFFDERVDAITIDAIVQPKPSTKWS